MSQVTVRMIIPTHCKSCGKVIGHLWFKYSDRLIELRRLTDEFNERTPEAQALDELMVHRYCCRTMFMCQPERLVDMIRNRIE